MQELLFSVQAVTVILLVATVAFSAVSVYWSNKARRTLERMAEEQAEHRRIMRDWGQWKIENPPSVVSLWESVPQITDEEIERWKAAAQDYE